MSVTVTVGCQWGDEGKGRVVDVLAEKADVVVRFAGGSNAGHTVVAEGKTVKLHIIPSGILRKDLICLVGDGVVVNPGVVCAELDALEAAGFSAEGLRLSGGAHVVMPWHVRMDELEEIRRGKSGLGTTKQGIGPAYADKAFRTSVRLWDCASDERFLAKLDELLPLKNKQLEAVYGGKPFTKDEIAEQMLPQLKRLRPYLVDGPVFLAEQVAQGKHLLMEGAQGLMRDLEHGTYPYVTSSHAIAGGACLGTGLGPKAITRVVGVAKAYPSAVGVAVFPTELKDETGDYIRERGSEFGTTTGRPRDVGWPDLVVLRTAAKVNSLTDLAVTKLDTLAGLPTVKVCTHYEVDGRKHTLFPGDPEVAKKAKPVYEELPGWSEDIVLARTPQELPEEAKRFLRMLANATGTRVIMASVGAGRNQMVYDDKSPAGVLEED